MPSTVIEYFEYDKVNRVLAVHFRSGLTYHYFDVPEQVYNDMKSSRAKGIFLNREIKGKYPFKKVDISENNNV